MRYKKIANKFTAPRLLMTAIVLCLSAATVLAQLAPLDHPTVDQRIQELGISADSGYRFVVFGDQKGLWKKNEFASLLDNVASLSAEGGSPLLFMIDTGDIVENGRKSKQFEELQNILARRVSELPYLVAVGNHEVDKTSVDARQHVFQFLKKVVDDENFSADRLYYAKTIGRVRFLFLDTNDFVYDDADPVRAAAQMRWLNQALQTEVHPTIAVMHHAFVLSADKHRDHARRLWNHVYADGRTLPEKLNDGGIDLVLSGHIHTYEVFLLKRNAKQMWALNVSGRPKGKVLGVSKGSRRPKDWGNQAKKELASDRFGFTRLDQWEITQLDYMSKSEEADQFAVITVDETGNLEIEVRSLDGSILYNMYIP